MSRDKDNKMDVYTGGRLTKGVIETIAPHLKDTTLDGRFNAKANATSLAAKLDKTEAADLYPTKADAAATYATYANLAKTPDSIIAGAVTLDSNNQVASAAVVWPDGKPGTLTITSRDSAGNVLGYNITYGSPVIKTYTQPTITRNSSGATTNVPQIVVS